MSKEFAEARARGEAANEIDNLIQRLFVDTIGCCADLEADDQCERCLLRRDAARALARMQVAEAEAKNQLAAVHEHVAEACAMLGAETVPDTWTLRDYAARVVQERNALRSSAAALVGQEWVKRTAELSTALAAANEDLTAARALLREVLPWLDTEFFEEDRELHGRVVAHLEGR
jgi:hypothetical protein